MVVAGQHTFFAVTDSDFLVIIEDTYDNHYIKDTRMEEKASTKGWVYVVVCEPEKDATYLGLFDEEKEMHFIPAFESKDAANECFLSLPREKGKKYEVQAVHIEELYKDAQDNGFVVAMLDSDGSIERE